MLSQGQALQQLSQALAPFKLGQAALQLHQTRLGLSVGMGRSVCSQNQQQ